MLISDPNKLREILDDEALNSIESRFGKIERFLGPGDKFRFTCDRSGRCCRNRGDRPIMIFPYDAYRIQKHFKFSDGAALNKYFHRIYGAESDLPLLLLKFPKNPSGGTKCVFLRSYGCGIYKDRPLVCRLYPVGRIIDRDMNSYFLLTQTGPLCRLGKGKEHSIEEWLAKADVEPYFEWANRYHSLFLQIDFDKYHKLDRAYKAAFGDILYDFAIPQKIIRDKGLDSLADNSEDMRLKRSFNLAQAFVEEYLK